MNREGILPISWEGWDPGDQTEVFLYKAIFLEDFGSIKKDTKFESLYINYTTGSIVAYDEEGEELIKQKFKAEPC